MLRTVSLLSALVMALLFAFSSPSQAQWVQVIDSTVPFPFNFGPFAAIGSIGKNVIMGGEQDVFLSTDNGISWLPLSNNFGSVYQFETFGSDLFAGSSGGLSLSNDSGKTWSWLNFYSQGFAIKSSGGNLFAGGSDTLVSISKDSGMSWSSACGNLPHNSSSNVQDLTIMDSNILICCPDFGVFLSTDYGINWMRDSIGLEVWNGYEAWPFTHVTTIGSAFFISSGDSGVYRSRNNGLYWSKVDNGLTALNVYALISVGNYLFAGTGSKGIFLSTDYGDSWENVNDGIDCSVGVLAICGDQIYMGSLGNGGVYRRPLSDFGISSVATPHLANQALSAFPNPLTHSTTLNFTAAESGYATVTIVNQLGEEVARVFAGEIGAGEHSFQWNAPAGLAKGMYECIFHQNGITNSIPVMISP